MCICVYIYIHVYMYRVIFICMYVCMYVSAYMLMCTHTVMFNSSVATYTAYTYTGKYIHTCIRSSKWLLVTRNRDVHKHVCVHVHIYIYIHIYIYVYTCIYIYIYTCTYSPNRFVGGDFSSCCIMALAW